MLQQHQQDQQDQAEIVPVTPQRTVEAQGKRRHVRDGPAQTHCQLGGHLLKVQWRCCRQGVCPSAVRRAGMGKHSGGNATTQQKATGTFSQCSVLTCVVQKVEGHALHSRIVTSFRSRLCDVTHSPANGDALMACSAAITAEPTWSSAQVRRKRFSSMRS